MIVCHTHQFILIKPRKVGGTSVQANLTKHCGHGDMFTGLMSYSPNKDEDYYRIADQNAEGLRGHATPSSIRAAVGDQIWRGYTIISMIRNPWDLVVSSYYWEKWRQEQRQTQKAKRPRQAYSPLAFVQRFTQSRQKGFSEYVAKLPEMYLNKEFYFDAAGDLVADYHIRYESLEADYQQLCDDLGVPYERLPRLKTSVRKSKRHYSTYYNAQDRELVAHLFSDQIGAFGYTYCSQER